MRARVCSKDIIPSCFSNTKGASPVACLSILTMLKWKDQTLNWLMIPRRSESGYYSLQKPRAACPLFFVHQSAAHSQNILLRFQVQTGRTRAEELVRPKRLKSRLRKAASFPNSDKFLI